MIVYQSNKAGFRTDVATGDIDQIILGAFRRAHGRGVGQGEQRSWHQSLLHVQNVLGDSDIPDDVGVSVELQIPQTSKRIDVVLTGQDGEGADNAVIIELKQWETAEATRMDAIVRTFVGGGCETPTTHRIRLGPMPRCSRISTRVGWAWSGASTIRSTRSTPSARRSS